MGSLVNGNRSPSSVPRLVLPDEFFVNIGRLIGSEVNRALSFLQDVACEGSLKQFVLVISLVRFNFYHNLVLHLIIRVVNHLIHTLDGDEHNKLAIDPYEQ